MNQALPHIDRTSGNASLRCYHCALPIPFSGTFVSNNNGEPREFCCAGCQAITAMIEQGGLENYYRFREVPGQKPDENRQDNYDIYDRPCVRQKISLR